MYAYEQKEENCIIRKIYLGLESLRLINIFQLFIF